jgi:Ser/Thr protein kinase RdoA (MazF antagonist)
MNFDTYGIVSTIKENYQLDVSAKKLPGELDLNFYLETPGGAAYIFKVANQNELRVNLELQNACIRHLLSKNLGLTVSTLVTSITNQDILELKSDTGNIRLARLLTWVEGRVLASVNPHSTNLLERLGEMCGTLCLSLVDFDHPAAHRFMKWNPSEALWIKPHLINFRGERKELVAYFLTLFETTALPLLPHLRKSINYNDANDYNVLVSHDAENPTVPGVIDFGDLVYTHTVNELAIAIAYAIMGKTDPLEAACHIVTGFNNKLQLTEQELKSLFPLTIARLLISITCSELNRLGASRK